MGHMVAAESTGSTKKLIRLKKEKNLMNHYSPHMDMLMGMVSADMDTHTVHIVTDLTVLQWLDGWSFLVMVFIILPMDSVSLNFLKFWTKKNFSNRCSILSVIFDWTWYGFGRIFS